MSARLFCILARAAPAGVIFRRGPSKWVRLIKWNTETDSFERGQWFRGRIYERRCDLSPDGSLLIYFAQKITAESLDDSEYTYAWTAISRPPWLTALALWPKGDCWHGGGLFDISRKGVWLNHRPECARPHPDHRPRGLIVRSNPEAYGEDYPIYDIRLRRDGWVTTQEGSYPWEGRGPRTEKAEVRQKPNRAGTMTLRMTLDAVDFAEYGGPYVTSYRILRPGGAEIPVDGASWADWDQQDRLVFIRDGKVFEGEVAADGLRIAELAEFNDDKPERIKSPEWAREW